MKLIRSIVVLVISYCLAIPTFLDQKRVKKEIPTASENGSNLLQVPMDASSLLVLKNISTKINPKPMKIKSDIQENQNVGLVQSRTFENDLPNKQSQNEQFKVKILDLNNPIGQHKTEPHKISIGSPIYHQSPPIIAPQVYVVQVPHYVVIKEPNLLNVPQHLLSTRLTGQFQPFQEIPSLTQGFPISTGDNLFGTTDGVYPIHPIEIPQLGSQPINSGIIIGDTGLGLEGQYPIIISGGSEIPVISDISELPQGLEIINAGNFGTVGLTDENIDDDKESITVEASENLSKIGHENKNNINQKEKRL